MKHQKSIDKIRRGDYTRAELIQLRKNVEQKILQGDQEAQAILQEIDRTTPSDKYIVFMGFCPGADFDNRLDIGWREQGVCTFVFHESDQQSERFDSIWPGDLIVLKKRHRFGETMQLFGYGRVVGFKYDPDGHRVLQMDWSDQQEIIELPLMGCNSTVDIRTIEQVEAQMPTGFFDWLGYARR